MSKRGSSSHAQLENSMSKGVHSRKGGYAGPGSSEEFGWRARDGPRARRVVEAHAIPRLRVHAWTRNGYEWGKWVFYYKWLNNYELSGGITSYLFYILVHSSPYLFVCDDDRVICYSGAYDVTGEPGAA